MGNVFALLGLRALFVLVEGLIRRFRYLDQTIAIVLAAVAVKLLIEELVYIGPIPSLAGVALLFAGGIVASVIADRRDPDADRKREERARSTEADADATETDAAQPDATEEDPAESDTARAK
jgi:tellurite resistance protein TerC